jgi:hypothetical protein
MTRLLVWTPALAATLFLTASAAHAQPIYGGGYGGYWGGGGGQTVQGSIAQGMGVYAAGAGAYNMETAQARSINAATAMQFNQYVYQSKLESEKIYHNKLARDKDRGAKNADAVRLRLRDNPTSVDIAKGDALNVALSEMSDPKIFPKAVYYGHKSQIGGELIRDIPFSSGAAAISISVHQLTQGGAPPVLRDREEFAPDRAALRATAAEFRKEGDETGTHKPETIQKAKDQILATKAKIEAILPKGSPDRVAADKFVKALYAFVKMIETPAANVLLAGVEKHPEATVGDLLAFMSAYNLRFGVAQTPRQKEVYNKLYPLLVQIRAQVVPTAGADSPAAAADPNAPMAAFDHMTFDQIDGKTPPPAANPPK